jgi:hypothetical protein
MPGYTDLVTGGAVLILVALLVVLALFIRAAGGTRR